MVEQKRGLISEQTEREWRQMQLYPVHLCRRYCSLQQCPVASLPLYVDVIGQFRGHCSSEITTCAHSMLRISLQQTFIHR